jgi:pilus assembly protein CpaF
MNVMVAMAGMDLPEKTIRQQIASAVNIIVQISRLMDGSRRTTYITEITGMEGETVTMQDIYRYEGHADTPGGKIHGRHVTTGIRPKISDQLIAHGQVLPDFVADEPERADPPKEEAKAGKSGKSKWGD